MGSQPACPIGMQRAENELRVGLRSLPVMLGKFGWGVHAPDRTEGWQVKQGDPETFLPNIKRTSNFKCPATAHGMGRGSVSHDAAAVELCIFFREHNVRRTDCVRVHLCWTEQSKEKNENERTKGQQVYCAGIFSWRKTVHRHFFPHPPPVLGGKRTPSQIPPPPPLPQTIPHPHSPVWLQVVVHSMWLEDSYCELPVTHGWLLVIPGAF